MSLSNQNLELKRISFDFEEKLVLVRCLTDQAGVKLGDNTITLHKGAEIEPPAALSQIDSIRGVVLKPAKHTGEKVAVTGKV